MNDEIKVESAVPSESSTLGHLTAFSPTSRDWPEDSTNDPDNGTYTNQCIVCQDLFTGHKRRVVCKICHGKDMVEAEKRAEWLTAHKAPIDWIILTNSEIQAIKGDLIRITNKQDDEQDARKALQQALSNLLSNRGPYQIDRAKEALEVAKRLDGAPPSTQLG